MRLALRDLMGLIVWLYMFGQLVVLDVDHQVEKVIPWSRHVLPYKFLFVLACLITVALFSRRLILPFLYVLFFPLVVVFWKMPRLLYKARSGTMVLGLVNVISSAFTDFAFNFLAVGSWIFGAVFALSPHKSYLQWPALALLSYPLIRSYLRTLRFSFQPSRFVKLQTKAIARVVNADFTTNLVAIDPKLRDTKLKKFNETQLQQFVQKVQFAIVTNRFLYTWAYQLDQYRKGPLPYIFSLLSYIWLFISTLITLTLVNIAVLHISPTQFAFVKPPSIVVMMHYTLTSFAWGTITQVDAAKTAAQWLQILGGVLGPALLLTVIGNFVFSRTSAQDESLQDAVRTIKARGLDFRQRFQSDFDVSMEDAIARLEALGTTALLGIISFLSRQFPEDFAD